MMSRLSPNRRRNNARNTSLSMVRVYTVTSFFVRSKNTQHGNFVLSCTVNRLS